MMLPFHSVRNCAGKPDAYLLAHAVSDGDIGGAQKHCQNIIEGLCDDPMFDHLLVAGSEGALTQRVRELGVKVEIVPDLYTSYSLPSLARGTREMRRVLSHHGVDIVHLHSTKTGVIGRRACRQLSVPNVFSVHGWSFGERQPALRSVVMKPVEIVLASATNCYVFETQADFDLASTTIAVRRRPLHLIHNGVPIPPDPPRLMQEHTARGSSDHRPFRFAMVARFAAQKAQDQAVTAFQSLPPDVDAELHFFGTGPLEEAVRRQAEGDSRIHFHGSVPDVMSRLTEDFDAFLLLSHFEGMPIALIEAMAGGMPVLAYDVGGIPELLGTSGQRGFCLPHGQTEEVARAMARLTKDPELCMIQGRQSREWVQREFSVDAMVSKFRQLYLSQLADY